MVDDTYIPTLTHATERDIDLLLVEEIYSNHQFVCWLTAHAGLPSQIASWDVQHSKRRTRNRREIDIFVEMTLEDRSRCALLIENKLDATDQPDQAESYRDELNVLAGDYQRSAMIIVCPDGYRAQNNGFTSKFDATVTYEAIHRWFVDQDHEAGSESVLRHRFRAELFDQAINKHRRGYTAIPDKVVGDFNSQYVALLSKIAPNIHPGNSMLKPANPRESTSMIFDQNKSLSQLPKDIRPSRFSHELGRGSQHRANYVAVTFAGWGTALTSIRDLLEADTSEIGASFSSKPPSKNRPNPGLVMSFPTKPIDNQARFDDQLKLIEDGMKAAILLRNWLLENQKLVVSWRDLVAQTQRQS